MNFFNLFHQTLFHSIPLFRKILTAVSGSTAWLVDAIPLKVYRSKDKRFRSLVNEFYLELLPHMKVSNKSRTKEAIKTVLLNLWMGTLLNRPTRCSRNRNDYKSGRRYGLLFMKYDRLIPVIDTLEHLGYIKQKKGFLVHDKELGYQTRIWATDALIQRFEDAGLIDYGFFYRRQTQRPHHSQR